MRVRHPLHRTSTANLQAIYPGIATAGLPCSAVYVGRDCFGGSFCYDPWELYAEGCLTGPNMLVIGSIGQGKSALVKSYVYRQLVFGRQAILLDPKGENGPLCRAVGTRPVALAPGGPLRLNPLDDRAGGPGRTQEDVDQARAEVVAAILGAQLGRSLRSDERTIVQGALRAAADSAADGQPTLRLLVGQLLDPAPSVAAWAKLQMDEVRRIARESAYELRRLVDGDLRGMFDGPTSGDIDLEAPVVSFDLSAVYQSNALGILMVCVSAWLQQLLRRQDGRKRIVVLDEAWAVLRNVEIARWLQGSYKFSRAYGVQYVAVIHRLSDLAAAGSAGSHEERLAEGLLSDSETVVLYHQPPNELERARKLLELNDVEAAYVADLTRGEALWRVGRRSFVVAHRLSERERPIVDTDVQMRDVGVVGRRTALTSAAPS